MATCTIYSSTHWVILIALHLSEELKACVKWQNAEKGTRGSGVASVCAGLGVKTGKGVSDQTLWTGYWIFIFFLALHGVWNMGKRLDTRPQGHLGETTAVKRMLLLAPKYLDANNRNHLQAIVSPA